MMEDMQELLTAHPEFKSKLFCRGFLLTDADNRRRRLPILRSLEFVSRSQ